MKQKQTHKEQTVVGGGWGGTLGEGRIGSLGLVDANCYVQNG